MAQLAAAEWKKNKEQGIKEPAALSVYDAVSKYFDLKRSVLPPPTLRGYKGMQKNYFKNSFGQTLLSDLNNETVQLWVSELASRLSPKTVSNAYGLLSATLELFHQICTSRCNFRQKSTQSCIPLMITMSRNCFHTLMDVNWRSLSCWPLSVHSVAVKYVP